MSELLKKFVDQARREGRSYLMEHECKEIFEGIGISTTGSNIARNEDEAVEIFNKIRSPVVLKILSPDVVHKSDLGGVKLDLRDSTDVRSAYRELIKSFCDKEITGVSVQEMAEPGIEAIVGVVQDPTFGPILMFGLGGVLVEILEDVSLRSIPITESDADEMIKEIRGYSLLKGYRGYSADIPNLLDLLMRISDFIIKNPEIVEMDLNPVFLYPKGYKVADARIILGERETPKKRTQKRELHDLFYPKSIAVVGASATEGKLGWNVFHNLISHNFEGNLYPINPRAKTVQGIKAYPRIADVKEPIDVAVVLVHAKKTPEIVRECCENGVKYVIVESAGFAEMGEEGKEIEAEILELTEPCGCRVLGPNCSGVINTHCSMVQSIGIVDALSRGNIGLISQAGVCAAGMLWGLRHILDFGIVATIGNKLDINETDMLEAVSFDENIDVICMYLESVKGGRQFIEVAKRITKEKPIIALKSGRTEAGKKAVASHTASMAGDDRVYSAIFKQAGIIRARDYEHMFNLAKAISKQPLPLREGVFIITYAGSLGVISADAITDNGLRLAELEPELKERLFDLMPEYVGGTNPVDYTFSMNAEVVKETIEIGIESADVGSIIVVLQAEILGSYVQPLRSIDYKDKPVLACVAGKEFAMDDFIEMENAGIPVFTTPEQVADALAVMYNYGKHLRG